MNIPCNSCRILRHVLLSTLIWFGCGLALRAQPATGTIEGRVFNPATGAILERAGITVDGTTLATFTDADGYHRQHADDQWSVDEVLGFTASSPVFTKDPGSQPMGTCLDNQ